MIEVAEEIERLEARATAAEATVTALQERIAELEAQKPVAYVYSKPGMQVEFRLRTERCFAGDGWTEEPLYAARKALDTIRRTEP